MKFLPPEAFAKRQEGYRLLPMRFRRLPWDTERVLVSSISGDWLIMPRTMLDALVDGAMDPGSVLATDLEARHLITRGPLSTPLAPLLSQVRTRKRFLQAGPALHLFVVSLRCHHTCNYCQVSRQDTAKTAFDMSGDVAELAVERLFEWPGHHLTIEFQGGEPLLHFGRVRDLTERILARNEEQKRGLKFVLTSTLHDLTDEQLDFFAEHKFQLSTSLDGPEWLHDANRPRPGRDSYRRTIEGIGRARCALGEDAISALTTLTQRSLSAPQEIVDEYRKQGLHSIFLRPLSPYGFARRTAARNSYPLASFQTFYRKALDHILAINRSGYAMKEVYGGLILSQLLTPFSHGYVDLRSPTGGCLGAVVYDYDGQVYPSDEARMLAAMGDTTFAIGRVEQPVAEWLDSPAMQRLLDSGVAESLPGCSDCAFVPLCGADPVDHYARQGDLVGHRPSSDFCAKQIGFFDLMLQRLELADPEERKILEDWALPEASTKAHVEVA